MAVGLLAVACGGGSPPATTPAAKDAGTPADAAARFGPTYDVKDRIVNLADAGGRRYLRYTASIEFAPVTPPAGAKDPATAFQAEVKPYSALIEDDVTTVLSSETSADLATPEGKDQAKKLIAERLRRDLAGRETVTNVYFTDFVMQ